MKIDASHINNWAQKIEARSEVPRLVRKLMHASGNVTFCNVPAGGAVNQPGWDGELISESGNAWIPKGRSFWEISCEVKIAGKATSDYKKRTASTTETIRKNSAFVFVTPRQWSETAKKKWLNEKQELKEWADIKVYDALDLEQWLEQYPAVALIFSDELGITGHGIESVAHYWATWSQQTAPAIAPQAILAERDYAKNELISGVQKRLDSATNLAFSIQADSVEEAVAFVCAAISEHPDMETRAAVITRPEGWRILEQNPSIKIAVAARPELAGNAKQHAGHALIIPFAAGDLEGHFGAGKDSADRVRLERPGHQSFEKALISCGIEESDATRLANLTGRSWSVLRRQRATNPAIRNPAWLGHGDVASLSILCLVGGWVANTAADQAVVAEIANDSYESIEKKLAALATVDDSPIIKIGNVWKAKSSLELLNLVGHHITRNELDRFFTVSERILSQPDPQLGLPDEERHAAQIHGKVRPNSGLLIRSLCDSLIKLSVRGTQIQSLQHFNLEDKVALFVRGLLQNADETRWLSLASHLSPLAEAAPGEFLKALEQSLATPNQPVTRLLKETSSSSIFGRCWHSDLLWALEVLAWAPERLLRISLIAAKLAKIEIKGNWSNYPINTLTDFYRSWLPQTAASIEQRIEALRQLVASEPDIGFELIEKLVHKHSDVATPASRPKWREDDAGAGRGTTGKERHEMVLAAADMQIEMAAGHPDRIDNLLSKIDIYDEPRREKIFSMARVFANSPKNDEACEILRKPLRSRIHWHSNYSKKKKKELSQFLAPLESLYAELEPDDLILRYKWLFADGWPDLPMRHRDEDYRKRDRLVGEHRQNALKEIYEKRSLGGIEALAAIAQPHIVGFILGQMEIDTQELTDWIVASESRDYPWFGGLMGGLLRALPDDKRNDLLEKILTVAEKSDWTADRISRLLSLAPVSKTIWDMVAGLGAKVEGVYWNICNPDWAIKTDEVELEFVLGKLLAAQRPRTAFSFCHLELDKVKPEMLADIMEQILQGHEHRDMPLDSYEIQQAVERLEAGALDKQRLIRIEFGLIPALGYENEQCAETLYNALLSDPKLFTELLCILYKPKNKDREKEEPVNESTQAAATIAWRILHHCKQLPGQQPNGSIDAQAFVAFIDSAREMAEAADRLEVCESTLGNILAHAPDDEDGTWPCRAIRDVLNRPELENMRRGLHTGVLNKRGAHWRSLDEGGKQERDLAAQYEKYAQALYNSHPALATTLADIADSYQRDARREDLDARLRQEAP